MYSCLTLTLTLTLFNQNYMDNYNLNDNIKQRSINTQNISQPNKRNAIGNLLTVISSTNAGWGCSSDTHITHINHIIMEVLSSRQYTSLSRH